MNGRAVIIGVLFILAAVWGYTLLRRESGRAPQPIRPFETKTDTGGSVTVSVTPQNVAAGAVGWEFSVVLDTHSADLTEDLAATSVLVDDAGREYRARAWVGDPPGGHHRTGTLQFGPLSPLPRAITLKLRQVGGVAERTFVWAVAP